MKLNVLDAQDFYLLWDTKPGKYQLQSEQIDMAAQMGQWAFSFLQPR